MSTHGTDPTTTDETTLASRVSDWFGERPDDVVVAEGATRPCASCGNPDGSNWLLLTVEWEEALAGRHGVEPPDEECHVPLCTRCRSWAEMLEIAEMNEGNLGAAERRTVVEERNRFLETLRVELVTNFTVSTTLEAYE